MRLQHFTYYMSWTEISGYPFPVILSFYNLFWDNPQISIFSPYFLIRILNGSISLLLLLFSTISSVEISSFRSTRISSTIDLTQLPTPFQSVCFHLSWEDRLLQRTDGSPRTHPFHTYRRTHTLSVKGVIWHLRTSCPQPFEKDISRLFIYKSRNTREVRDSVDESVGMCYIFVYRTGPHQSPSGINRTPRTKRLSCSLDGKTKGLLNHMYPRVWFLENYISVNEKRDQ